MTLAARCGYYVPVKTARRIFQDNVCLEGVVYKLKIIAVKCSLLRARGTSSNLNLIFEMKYFERIILTLRPVRFTRDIKRDEIIRIIKIGRTKIIIKSKSLTKIYKFVFDIFAHSLHFFIYIILKSR